MVDGRPGGLWQRHGGGHRSRRLVRHQVNLDDTTWNDPRFHIWQQQTKHLCRPRTDNPNYFPRTSPILRPNRRRSIGSRSTSPHSTLTNPIPRPASHLPQQLPPCHVPHNVTHTCAAHHPFHPVDAATARGNVPARPHHRARNSCACRCVTGRCDNAATSIASSFPVVKTGREGLIACDEGRGVVHARALGE